MKTFAACRETLIKHDALHRHVTKDHSMCLDVSVVFKQHFMTSKLYDVYYLAFEPWILLLYSFIL